MKKWLVEKDGQEFEIKERMEEEIVSGREGWSRLLYGSTVHIKPVTVLRMPRGLLKNSATIQDVSVALP